MSRYNLPPLFCVVSLLIRPVYSARAKNLYAIFIFPQRENNHVCLFRTDILLLAAATASVRNRRECTCYPLRTRTCIFFFGDGCVYGVSVLIIRHLVRVFFSDVLSAE